MALNVHRYLFTQIGTFNSWPFPTMTRSGVVGREWRSRARTKLWVLPPSTNITTSHCAIWPTKRRVSGARWPERVWRLIWAWGKPTSSSGLGWRSTKEGSIWASSSSSAIRKKTLDAHLWPQWYFSSRLKHKPFSRWLASSSGDNHLREGGGEFLVAGEEREMGGSRRG